MIELNVKKSNRSLAQLGNTNASKSGLTREERDNKEYVLAQRCRSMGWVIDRHPPCEKYPDGQPLTVSQRRKVLERADNPMLWSPLGQWIVAEMMDGKLHKREANEMWDVICDMEKVLWRFRYSIELNPFPKGMSLKYVPDHISGLAEEQQTRRSLTPEESEAQDESAKISMQNMESRAISGMGHAKWLMLKSMIYHEQKPYSLKMFVYSYLNSARRK